MEIVKQMFSVLFLRLEGWGYNSDFVEEYGPVCTPDSDQCSTSQCASISSACHSRPIVIDNDKAVVHKYCQVVAGIFLNLCVYYVHYECVIYGSYIANQMFCHYHGYRGKT